MRRTCITRAGVDDDGFRLLDASIGVQQSSDLEMPMKRRSNITLECSFEIGHIEGMEYTVTIDNATPGSPPGRDDPGDGPEIEWCDFVDVTINGEAVGVVPWDVFTLAYAASYQISISDAEAAIETALYDRYSEYVHDDYDDYDDYDDRSGWYDGGRDD